MKDNIEKCIEKNVKKEMFWRIFKEECSKKKCNLNKEDKVIRRKPIHSKYMVIGFICLIVLTFSYGYILDINSIDAPPIYILYVFIFLIGAFFLVISYGLYEHELIISRLSRQSEYEFIVKVTNEEYIGRVKDIILNIEKRCTENNINAKFEIRLGKC